MSPVFTALMIPYMPAMLQKVLLLATSIIGTVGFALGFALMMALDVVLG